MAAQRWVFHRFLRTILVCVNYRIMIHGHHFKSFAINILMAPFTADGTLYIIPRVIPWPLDPLSPPIHRRSYPRSHASSLKRRSAASASDIDAECSAVAKPSYHVTGSPNTPPVSPLSKPSNQSVRSSKNASQNSNSWRDLHRG